MSAALTSFATTHWVIDWIHDHTTVAGTTSQMTIASGFSAHLKIVFGITHNANCRTACLKNHTHLATWHLDDSILVVAGHQLCIGTCGTNHLGALTRTELNIVNKCTERNLRKKQRITNFGRYTSSGHYLLSYFESLRAKNITLLAICIYDERYARTAIGVILYCLYDCRDTIFVSFEIDKTIELLVTTAYIAHRHLTLVVTSTTFALAINKRLFRASRRDIVISNYKFVTLTRSCRFNLF